MYYAVKNLGEISCAHRLFAYNGPCSRIHGHNYKTEIVVTAPNLVADMVIDFQLMKSCNKVLQKYDHRLILCKTDPLVTLLTDNSFKDNIVVLDSNPTVEVLAKLWLDEMNESAKTKGFSINEIHAWENSNSYAVYIHERQADSCP